MILEDNPAFCMEEIKYKIYFLKTMTVLIVNIRHRLIELTTVPFWPSGGLPHWKGWWPSPGPSGNQQSAPTNNPQPHRQLWGKSLGKPRWLNDFPKTTRQSLVSWNLSRSFLLSSHSRDLKMRLPWNKFHTGPWTLHSCAPRLTKTDVFSSWKSVLLWERKTFSRKYPKHLVWPALS